MSATTTLPSSAPAAETKSIDCSLGAPVLAFFSSAIFWLLAGTVLGLIDSIKLHSPGFLDCASWLTYGRIHPAFINVMTFGWATSAAFGVIIWLLGRLDRTPMCRPGLLIVPCMLWNIGLGLGVLGILGGISTGVEWLEIPRFAAAIMFVAYALIAIWGVMSFRFREQGSVYISQLYILAALFWFPWSYGSAQFLLNVSPVQASIQGIVGWWYAHNLISLWFTPIGLACAYYFIPKIVGKPVYSYKLAATGFWLLAFLSGWNGAYYLNGGPFPVWVVTVSIVAGVLMLIPVGIVAVNHHLTVKGRFSLLHSSPTLRFIVFGAIAYTVASCQEAVMAFRSYGDLFNYTLLSVAHMQLEFYAFVTMILFGAMYFIIPRLVGSEWRSARLIHLHFWACFYGLLLMMLTLHVGGFKQGFDLADPSVPFEQVTRLVTPYLVGRTLSLLLITIGQLAFAAHFIIMVARLDICCGSCAEKEAA